MRLGVGRLVRRMRRQLRHLIGAAIRPSSRSPENVDGQGGRNRAAFLAVSTSRLSHDRVSHFTAIAILTLRAHATWFETVRVRWARISEMGFQFSLRCWLLGHEDLVRTTTGRLYLECMECGRQTPGWRTGKSRVGGKPRRNEGARDAVDDARCASTPSNRAALKAA